MPRGAKGGRHVVVTGSTEVACHVAKGSREGACPLATGSREGRAHMIGKSGLA